MRQGSTSGGGGLQFWMHLKGGRQLGDGGDEDAATAISVISYQAAAASIISTGYVTGGGADGRRCRFYVQ